MLLMIDCLLSTMHGDTTKKKQKYTYLKIHEKFCIWMLINYQ